jgi:peptidoglycan-associated lipoprotein
MAEYLTRRIRGAYTNFQNAGGENMQKNLWRTLALLLISLHLVFTVSCHKKSVAVETGTNTTDQTGGYDPSTADQSDIGEEYLHSTTAEDNGDSNIVLQENIFFEYDKATLTPKAREILTNNGKWLKLKSDILITIEGHCDERGTNAYNIALGDRRAESVKTFLVDLGIERSRLATVSFGEERPLDLGHGEAAWTRNRRAHFLIR